MASSVATLSSGFCSLLSRPHPTLPPDFGIFPTPLFKERESESSIIRLTLGEVLLQIRYFLCAFALPLRSLREIKLFDPTGTFFTVYSANLAFANGF